jgi:predicted Fe-Mo cluster-binding NifX family protein
MKKKVPHLGDLVLYVDPPKPHKIIVALPVKDTRGLESEIAIDDQNPFHILVVELMEHKITKSFISKRAYRFKSTAWITKFLKENKVNIFISSQLQTLLYYPLRLANIRVYPQFQNVKDAKHTVELLLLDF